ncbi:MAG: cellulase family glycosylhydrolase [Blastochloris sp.]|nr:cellulase family glycosylhydrolase [Blastochloris sp.]
MNRRNFLTASLASGVLAGCSSAPSPTLAPVRPKNPIPKWMGFNLQWMLAYRFQATPLEFYQQRRKERHLEWMTSWGFDFVRLGTSYWDLLDQRFLRGIQPGINVAAENVNKLDPKRLLFLRETVDLLLQHDLHVNLAMHRLPGDAVWNHESEPFPLYRDPRGDEAMAFWWTELAQTFSNIPAQRLSFNLLNELPSHWDPRAGRDHLRRTMMIGVEVVRAISPDRLIFIDGSSAGREIMDAMIADPVCHSLHAYSPLSISHVQSFGDARTATWPEMDEKGRERFGRKRLELVHGQFGRAVELGQGVHCGEAGAQAQLPAQPFLAWMKDNLDILSAYDIGCALWEFQGGFGLLDTGRAGMRKEKWHGHDLDVELLELLQSHQAPKA